MKPIRVAVLGLGRSGRDMHGAYLSEAAPRYKLVAVSDPLPDRQDRARQEYGCAVYADYRRLLRDVEADLVVNALPSNLHVPVSIECLKAGFNVLCEKPLARRLAEVDRITAAAVKAQRRFMVFQSRRYDHAFVKTMEVISSGILGRIVLVKIASNGFLRRWDWQTVRSMHGGNLMNNGSHYLDQALQFMGCPSNPRVTCFMDNAVSCGDAEDHIKLVLSAPKRPVVDVEVSNCCTFPGPLYNVFGTRGGLTGTDSELKWKYFRPAEQTKRKLDLAPVVGANGLPAYCRDDIKWKECNWTLPADAPSTTRLYYGMLHGVLTRGSRPEVTMDQVRQQVGVIEKCYKSGMMG